MPNIGPPPSTRTMRAMASPPVIDSVVGVAAVPDGSSFTMSSKFLQL